MENLLRIAKEGSVFKKEETWKIELDTMLDLIQAYLDGEVSSHGVAKALSTVGYRVKPGSVPILIGSWLVKMGKRGIITIRKK